MTRSDRVLLWCAHAGWLLFALVPLLLLLAGVVYIVCVRGAMVGVSAISAQLGR